MARSIVVIGAGPAAVFAAMAAKKQDAAADVVLLSDESCEPYEKPPLSKGVLTGKAKPEDAPIAGPGGLAKHGVTVRLGTRCSAIDRGRQEVLTGVGRLRYDTLVIATGSLMRELPLLPAGMANVHYLRTEPHARALKEALGGCKQLVVVGAGTVVQHHQKRAGLGHIHAEDLRLRTPYQAAAVGRTEHESSLGCLIQMEGVRARLPPDAVGCQDIVSGRR